MIRITIETNAATGIGYQLHLKDTTRHREWIARDDRNGMPGGKPFLDLESTAACAKAIIIGDAKFTKHGKDISRNLRVADEALEANKDRDLGARRMLAELKKGHFEKFSPDPGLYKETMRASGTVEYGEEVPGKPQKIKMSITPLTMILAVFGVAHEKPLEPKYAEVVQHFFELAAGQGFGDGGATAMARQYYDMDEDTANSWVVQLIHDAGISDTTLELMIMESFEKYDHQK
ncbi:hypothetical protein [uncultured Selenomonas sp.]|uniref:hypothetical protein n=1 Tax=uncultured Selenomonas sp. TaxID=159275 RepID=UPI0025F7D1D0|nr:hypothetical protein [uncultured Selenomonas sp.]